jgi:hypothetical protein
MIRGVDPTIYIQWRGAEGTLWKETRPYGGGHAHTVKGCPFPNYTD